MPSRRGHRDDTGQRRVGTLAALPADADSPEPLNAAGHFLDLTAAVYFVKVVLSTKYGYNIHYNHRIVGSRRPQRP